MSAKKERTLYVTRDGDNDVVYIWLGKPKRSLGTCDNCGGPEVTWEHQRGSRLLMEDVCDEGFKATGVNVPANGIVQFKVVVVE